MNAPTLIRWGLSVALLYWVLAETGFYSVTAALSLVFVSIEILVAITRPKAPGQW